MSTVTDWEGHRVSGTGQGDAVNDLAEVPAGPGQATSKPLTIDPDGMLQTQLAGEACVSCEKRWPRPTVLVGFFPDGGPARCCPECVPAVTG